MLLLHFVIWGVRLSHPEDDVYFHHHFYRNGVTPSPLLWWSNCRSCGATNSGCCVPSDVLNFHSLLHALWICHCSLLFHFSSCCNAGLNCRTVIQLLVHPVQPPQHRVKRHHNADHEQRYEQRHEHRQQWTPMLSPSKQQQCPMCYTKRPGWSNVLFSAVCPLTFIASLFFRRGAHCIDCYHHHQPPPQHVNEVYHAKGKPPPPPPPPLPQAPHPTPPPPLQAPHPPSILERDQKPTTSSLCPPPTSPIPLCKNKYSMNTLKTVVAVAEMKWPQVWRRVQQGQRQQTIPCPMVQGS